MAPSFPRVDDDVDELFALAPSEFTAARNDLVKRLKAANRTDEAAAVKALRRPTVPAWAVNQTARRNPAAVEALIAAGAAVATAQRRALSGVRDSGLRDASAQRRERVDELWRIAADVLAEAGVDPQPHRPAVAATLEAASVDADAAELVRRGRLTTDLPAPSGFGDVGGFSVVADTDEAAPEAPPPQDTGAEDPDAVARAAREALENARSRAATDSAAADEAQVKAGDAEQAAMRTDAEAQRLEHRAREVRERATRLREEAHRLAEEAAEARAAAEFSAAQVRSAEQAAADT